MGISNDKRRFIELLLDQQVLKFGTFKTKSGRDSPFFFNTGQVNSGMQVYSWAEHYAKALALHFGEGPYKLFGPAYKGIPLVVATAMVCSKQVEADTVFSFDRKEQKQHGEGGWMVGFPLEAGDSVIVLEDVLTGGTSIRATFEKLKSAGVAISGAIVGIDRQERGISERSAAQELRDDFGIPIFSLINLQEIVSTLYNQEVGGRVWIDENRFQAIAEYREKFGVSE